MKTPLIVALLLICSYTYAQDSRKSSVVSQKSFSKSDSSRLTTDDLRLTTSLEFIPSKGQIADTKGKVRPDILYIAHSGPVEFYLRNNGISYVINTLKNPHLNPGFTDDDPPGEEIKDSHQHLLKLRDEPFKTCRIDMDFVGASQPVTQNIAPTEGYLNYYLPQCPDGIKDVKAYQNVLYKGMYPNIDISFKGNFEKGIKYDIIVNPGGNPAKIRMKYTGAEKVEIKDGKLLLTAYTGKMEERIPKIYQQIEGTDVSVEGEYEIYYQGKDSLDGTIVGIKIKNYNKEYPLIIDPWWASYCGGSSDDEAYACALDNLSNTLVAGTATSADFPASVGAFQSSLVGAMNVFVIKFDLNGHRLWATYYGGSGSDGAYGITADLNNNVIVTGNTGSTDFPVSAGAFQTTFGGGYQDAFAIKFDPNGNRLWGTYCGGSNDDFGNAIITDYAGNVAITGYTNSTDFPVSISAFQNTSGGGRDAFVVKFDPNGNQLWGTYFGGLSVDEAFGISADANGNIAFSGLTYSTNFPISPGAWQNAQDEGFVAELDPNGNRLWATYFGGMGNGCACDKSNNVIIGGYVGGMVATPGVYEPALTTGSGFAAKFNPQGKRIWATFNNTNQSEGGDYAIAVDDGNNVYLEDDEEPPGQFGPACGFQSTYLNNRECLYIVKLDSNGKYSCSTYSAGTVYDEHEYVCANLATKNGRMALAGFTSGGIPTTPGVFQTTYPGGAFAPFVFNLCSFACGDTAPPSYKVSNIIVKSDSCLGYVSFTAHGSTQCDKAGGTFIWSFPGGNPASATGPYISNVLYDTAGTYSVTLKYIACSVNSLTQTFTLKSGFHDSLAIQNPPNCHDKGTATAYPRGGDAPYKYSWSNGATNQSDTGLATGTYTCVVKAKNGCRDTLVFKIMNPISPLFITKPKRDTGFCLGGTAALSVSGGSNFTWSPSAGLSCTHCSNPIATPTATTIYTVTGTDNAGCPDSTNIFLYVEPVPAFTLINTTPPSCGGYNLLKAIPADSSYRSWTWEWLPLTGLLDSGLSYNEVGPSKQITYTVTASNGYCSGSDTITVGPFTKSFPLSLIANPDTFCPGAVIHLVSSSPDKLKELNWTPVTGLRCHTCDSTTLNTSLITMTGTTYTIALIVEDSAGCIANDTVVLTIAPPIIAAISTPPKICPGDSVTLIASGGGNYLWSTGSTTSSITVAPPVTTSYSVFVTNSYDCNGKASKTVIVDGAALYACCDTTILIGNNDTLYADSSITYRWYPSTGISCDTCAEIIVSPTVTTTYTVIGTDNMGCKLERIITIEVNPCVGFFVPNVFTPNGDGINDEFVINTGDVTSYSIVIYNRWGREIYKSTDPAKYWNGNTENGEKACDGIYYYIITSACRDNIYNKNGYVQLIR